MIRASGLLECAARASVLLARLSWTAPCRAGQDSVSYTRKEKAPVVRLDGSRVVGTMANALPRSNRKCSRAHADCRQKRVSHAKNIFVKRAASQIARSDRSREQGSPSRFRAVSLRPLSPIEGMARKLLPSHDVWRSSDRRNRLRAARSRNSGGTNA
jgi:hypothetical protein